MMCHSNEHSHNNKITCMKHKLLQTAIIRTLVPQWQFHVISADSLGSYDTNPYVNRTMKLYLLRLLDVYIHSTLYRILYSAQLL